MRDKRLTIIENTPQVFTATTDAPDFSTLQLPEESPGAADLATNRAWMPNFDIHQPAPRQVRLQSASDHFYFR